MNYIDTYFRMGMYPSPVGLPFVSGNEGAGEVIAVGSGVTDLKVGDRVAASWRWAATPRSGCCRPTAR